MPELPSLWVTSSIEKLGAASSLMIVPVPSASLIVAPLALQIDVERFVRLELRVTIHQHRDLLCRFVGRKVQRSGVRLVVVVGDGGCSVLCLKVTVETKAVLPVLVTVKV